MATFDGAANRPHTDIFCMEDMALPAAELSAGTIVAALDRQVAEMVTEIETSALWRTLSDPATPDRLVAEALNEIHLEIAIYQPLAIDGAVRAIAQFPRQMPVAWRDEMLQHHVEEFDHGEMALRDYVAAVGDEDHLRRLTADNQATQPHEFVASAIAGRQLSNFLRATP